jgi:hypothetical protein
MSAFLAGGIEGVSARYAAQIQELLHSQTMKRMAAEQEAARAEAAAAARAALVEQFARSHEPTEPVKVESAPAVELADAVRQPAAAEAPPAEPLAQIVDVQA